MTIFEWVILFAIVLPIGTILWLVFILALANLPAFVRTIITTSKVARMKPVEPKDK